MLRVDRLESDPPALEMKTLYGETIVVHPWDKCDVEDCDADVDGYIFGPNYTEGRKYCYPHYYEAIDAK